MEIPANEVARAQRDHRAAARSGRAAPRRCASPDSLRAPKCSARNRNGIYIFVNRRLVRDRLAAARDQRGVSQHRAAGRFPGGAAIPRYAVPGSGRERAPGENRSALPPSAIRSRFHARRDSPRAFARAADSRISRRACGCSCGCRFLWAAHRFAAGQWRFRRQRNECRRAPLPQPELSLARRAPRFPSASRRAPRVSEGFELTGAPDRPFSQRFQFGPSGGAEFPFAAQQAGASRSRIKPRTRSRNPAARCPA